ncbi:hypothetical protein VCR1J2_20035 [Vibrio coralliirubri]|nr:hypothetical protein VCR1J2_20035 [Vibrio coralliirubri]
MTTKTSKTIVFIDKRQADKYIELINNLGFSNYQQTHNPMLHFNNSPIFPKQQSVSIKAAFFTTRCFKNHTCLRTATSLKRVPFQHQTQHKLATSQKHNHNRSMVTQFTIPHR